MQTEFLDDFAGVLRVICVYIQIVNDPPRGERDRI